MKNLKWKRAVTCFFLCMALIGIGFSSAESQVSKPIAGLKVAALMPGTTGYLYPIAIAPVVEKYTDGRTKMIISPTRGSAESLGYMRDKKMDMGFVGPELMFQSWYGKGPWEGKPDHSHRVLWVYATAVVQIVALSKSPIKTIYDLKGKRIASAEIGSAAAMMTEQIVTMLGLTPGKDVTLRLGKQSAAVDALKDGVVDAFSILGGPPSSSIVSLATTHDYRLLEIPAELKMADRINRKYYAPGVWVDYTLPKGIYPKQTSDLRSLATPYCLVVREDLPEDLIYEIVKIFWEHQGECATNYAKCGEAKTEELNLVKSEFAPFHPGALKYYREKGWIR